MTHLKSERLRDLRRAPALSSSSPLHTRCSHYMSQPARLIKRISSYAFIVLTTFKSLMTVSPLQKRSNNRHYHRRNGLHGSGQQSSGLLGRHPQPSPPAGPSDARGCRRTCSAPHIYRVLLLLPVSRNVITPLG